MNWKFGVLTALFLAFSWGCSKSGSNVSGSADASGASAADRPHVAYITNGVASFWVIAEAGANAASKEVDAKVTVLMPAEGVSDQKRMIEDMLAKGVDGMAVSPIDPENQVDLLNKAAKITKLVTHDSDAPGCERLAYVGMDNYLAGRLCGELVAEALPEGGKIAIFIGRLEQDNARRRRQGVIDEMLGRSHDPNRVTTHLMCRSKKANGTSSELIPTSSTAPKAKQTPRTQCLATQTLPAWWGCLPTITPLMLEALRQGGRSLAKSK